MGSIVPLYIFMLGKENFLGISMRAMESIKGEFVYPCRRLFLMGAGTPGIFWMSASISTKRFATAGSIDSLIEERLDPTVEGGGAGVVWGGRLTVGHGRVE